MISPLWLIKNDDLEKCDSIFQIGHLLGCNEVQWEFYCNSFKCRSYDKHSKTS